MNQSERDDAGSDERARSGAAPALSSTGAPTSLDERAIVDLLRDLDGAADPAEVVRRHSALHPHLADEFEDLAEMQGRMRPPESEASDGPTPERLGDFRIVGKLGWGGMGMVYEAVQEPLQRRVAVKTIRGGPRRASVSSHARFLREQTVLAKLHHTHIVPIHAAGRAGPLHYYAMQYIEGAALSQVVTLLRIFGSSSPTGETPTMAELAESAERRREQKAATEARAGLAAAAPDPTKPGPTPRWEAEAPAPPADGPPGTANSRVRLSPKYLRSVARVIADAADALQHAHEAGILHRDVKPGNLMVDRKEHCWVLDFGLAALRDHPGDASARHGPGLSGLGPDLAPDLDSLRTNGRIGTPRYMAPEQFDGRADALTDVWGLGVTLYELLTLSRPFDTEKQTLSAEPRRPRDLAPDVPPELEAICLKAIGKAPGERYASAGALRDDLKRWLLGIPTVAGKAGPYRCLAMWARREPALAAVIGVAVFAASLAVGVSLHASELRRQNSEAVTLVATADAKAAEADLRATGAREQSLKRELELLALPKLRGPGRRMDWFRKSSELVRSLRGGSTTPDSHFQAQASAALQGVDAHVVKSLPGAAQGLEFDPRSERLLISSAGKDEKGNLQSKTTLWDRTTDRTVVERDLGSGVPAFRPDGTPLQLSFVEAKPTEPPFCKILRLSIVTSGEVVREYRSPVDGLSQLAAIALSRDGSRLAAVAFPVPAGWDKPGADQGATPSGPSTIAVWNAASDKPICTMPHKATQDIALSPDGRLLAAWDDGGEISVWTLPGGKLHSRFRVGRAPVFCLTFGRDPVWHEADAFPPWVVAVGESSGLVTVWDLLTGRPRSVCRGSEYRVTAMDFSADGALLLTAGRTPSKLWDVATGACLLDMYIGDETRSIAFAPDGRHHASASAYNAAVEIVELDPGHGVQTLYGLQGAVEKTAFSPDGRLVAASTHEWQIGIWERASGRLLGVLPAPIGHFVDNLDMAFDGGGRRFACSAGRKARLWEMEPRRVIKEWDLPEGLCDSLAFSGKDQLLLVRQETQSRVGGPFSAYHPKEFPRAVRLYDLLGPNPKEPLAEISAFNWDVRLIKIAADGSLFAVDGIGTDQGKPQKRLNLYNGHTGELVRALSSARKPERSGMFCFAPDSSVLGILLDSSVEARMSLFDLPALTPRGLADATVTALSPGATLSLNLSGTAPKLFLSDVARGQTLLRVGDHDDSSSLSPNFSPDGRHAVFGRRDGTVSVLDFVEINRRLSEVHLGW